MKNRLDYKNYTLRLLLLFLCLSVSAQADVHILDKQCKKSSPSIDHSKYSEYNYAPNPHIPREVWNLVKPFLLPSNHPIKYQLDALFSRGRVCQNLHTLADAGFSHCYIRGYSLMVVTDHPMVRGYWLKMFIDEQDITDYPALIHRIEGARAIQDAIVRHGYQDHFVVPKKWIYPLPAEPSPSAGCHRKNFILVAEDMNIYTKSANKKKWATKITPPRALAIYTLFQELGLNDSIYPFNLPFCKDGRQAFIDTEHHHNWPVRFDKMLQHMPHALQDYWLRIIETHGHP